MSSSSENPHAENSADSGDRDRGDESESKPTVRTEIATLGAGCFWCIEAVLEQIDGVIDVRSGYMGGTLENPTYEDVCMKTTGHAEVVEVSFDPTRLSYEELLEHFWQLHDPTDPGGQGADRGPQYRSAIFVHSEKQREIAEKSKQKANASGKFSKPIATEITAAGKFWPAENYHQDYYRLNKRAPYCQMVIRPKLQKLGLEP